ncbi:hypothetical protein DTO169E5_2983 [Paecilomyces variotii]|nr:hypothetical protein DTO169E5_2983 [Paecilomyces variotii]
MSSSAFRGRARAYGDRFQRNSTPWIQKRNVQQAPPPPPRGEIIATIYQSDLQADKSDTTAKITNGQYLTSYNWLTGIEPRIIIPGKIAYHQNLDIVKEHCTANTSMPNRRATGMDSALNPNETEGRLRTILASKPDFSLQSVDIVACGSTLGNLLRFIRGKDKSFRILVEVVGTTVFFMRRENSPDEVIPDVRGYGHTFPEAYTTWSAKVKGSESHQRVMKYDFAGMSCLVRFEADGYLPPPTQNHSSRTPGEDPTEVEDNLLSSVERATISNVPSSGGSKTEPKSLNISTGGERISQSAIFDLKTRSIRKKDEDTLDIELPRLWISQIPNFILAHHKAGVFNDIQVVNVWERVTQWEQDQQATLAKFAELLNKIVSFARSSESGRFEIIHEDSAAVLELRAQCADAGRVLPASVAKEWSDEVSDSDGDSSKDSF